MTSAAITEGKCDFTSKFSPSHLTDEPISQCNFYHKDGYEDVYDPYVDPTINMVFSTAAYRLHTLIPGYYSMRDARYKETKKLKLRDSFRNPIALVESDNFDDLIRGIATQPVHNFDNVFTTEMTEWLFPR